MNDLKCVPPQEKINEAHYVLPDNGLCTTKADNYEDVLI